MILVKIIPRGVKEYYLKKKIYFIEINGVEFSSLDFDLFQTFASLEDDDGIYISNAKQRNRLEQAGLIWVDHKKGCFASKKLLSCLGEILASPIARSETERLDLGLSATQPEPRILS